jgi:hypothetical protein
MTASASNLIDVAVLQAEFSVLTQTPFQHYCEVVFLKRDVIVGDLHQLWECTVRQGQIGYDVEVQNIVSVHEHDLAALRRIELPAEPVPCSFRDFTTGYDEGVIHQDTAVCLGIENLMPSIINACW